MDLNNFWKMMQQMAGQQQGLNQQGMNLNMGQMSNDAQQQILQSMLKGQKIFKNIAGTN